MRRALAAIWILALVVATPADARKLARRTPHRPDLDGYWSAISTTKLERAAVYPSLVISAAQERAIPPPPVYPDDDVGQQESDDQDPGWRLARVAGEIRTSWLVDPADGKLPYSAAGRRLMSQPFSSDNPETRPLNERCLPFTSAGPPMLNHGGENMWEIVQTPDHVVIVQESNHDARIIPLRGRAAVDVARPPPPEWFGHSEGWYEGDSLVVRTTGFHPQQSQRRSGWSALYLTPDAIVTERFRRISAQQMLYSFEVHDPPIFTHDWRAEMPLNASRWPLLEYACHEANYSMTNILAGARAQEKVKAGAAPEPRR